MEVATLLELLNVLYPPVGVPHQLLPTQTQQADAQKKIYELMGNPLAWSLAGQLLDSLGQRDWGEDLNVRFIAAHTLAVKISRDWDSLPAEQYHTLKERLLHWLNQSATRTGSSNPITGEKIVLRKLAVAISALSFKLVPEPLKCWDNWLLEVIARATIEGGNLSPLLEILTVIAEEGERADLIGARRVQYARSVQDASGLVIRTLADSLTSGTLPAKVSALSCTQAWLASSHLNIDGPATLWPILLDILSNSLYLSAYATRSFDAPDEEENILQKSADCIEELVSGSHGGSTVGGGFVTKSRAEILLDWFSGDFVSSIIEVAVNSGEVSDAILSVFKLFISLIEHSISSIASTLSSTRSLNILRHLLRITTFPGYFGIDENVSALALPIWTLLQEELSDLGYLGNFLEDKAYTSRPILADDDTVQLIEGTLSDMGYLPDGLNLSSSNPILDQETATHLKSLSLELFKTLSRGLLVKSTWPSQSYITSNWTKDMIVSFRTHTRTDLGECLLACYYVCRDDLLADLVTEVKRLLAKPLGEEGSLEDLEAYLFCIRAIQDGIPLEECRFLPALFDGSIMSKIPLGDSSPLLRLRGTCLALIGAFAEWFKQHPSHLTYALNLVAPSLSCPDPDIISMAANAMRRLCHEGRKALVNDIAPLAQLIRSTEGKIPSDEYNKVLQSVASVLQALPPKELVDPILSLISPVLARLSQASQTYLQTQDTEQRLIIITQLQQIKACNQGLSEPDEDLIILDAETRPSTEHKGASELSQLEPIVNLRNHLSNLVCNVLALSANDSDMAVAVSELVRSCTSNRLLTAISLEPFVILTSCISNIDNDRSNLAIWFSLSTALLTATHRSKGSNLSPEEWNLIVGCVKQSVEVTASLLRSDADLKEQPDLVQTFLQFCSAIISTYGEVFQYLHEELQTIMSISIAGLKIEERVALQAASDLVRLCVQQTRKGALSGQTGVFAQLVTAHGMEVLNQLMLGIGGRLPRSSLPCLAETLHCFLIRLPEVSQVWLKDLLATPGYPSERLDEDRKERFMKSLFSARTLKKARDICTDFAIICRGLEGTAYGASQMSLSITD